MINEMRLDYDDRESNFLSTLLEKIAMTLHKNANDYLPNIKWRLWAPQVDFVIQSNSDISLWQIEFSCAIGKLMQENLI